MTSAAPKLADCCVRRQPLKGAILRLQKDDFASPQGLPPAPVPPRSVRLEYSVRYQGWRPDEMGCGQGCERGVGEGLVVMCDVLCYVLC